MEWIELLDPDDGGIGEVGPFFEDVVIDFPGTEKESFEAFGRGWIIEKFFKGAAYEIAAGRIGLGESENAFWNKDDEWFFDRSEGLSSEEVKILGWCGRVNDLDVVVCRELQKSLDPS